MGRSAEPGSTILHKHLLLQPRSKHCGAPLPKKLDWSEWFAVYWRWTAAVSALPASQQVRLCAHVASWVRNAAWDAFHGNRSQKQSRSAALTSMFHGVPLMLACWLFLPSGSMPCRDWLGAMTAVVTGTQNGAVICCIVRPDTAIAVAATSAVIGKSSLARKWANSVWRCSQRTARGALTFCCNNKRRLLKRLLCVFTRRQGAGGNVGPL